MAGRRPRGPRPRSASSCSRTACSRVACARATRSRSSRARRWSGRSSTSRSRTSARSGAAIYANSSPQDARYIVGHSEAVGVLCEDEEQRRKIEEGREELPRLQHVLTYADLAALEDEGRRVPRGPPGGARRRRRGDRRGRPLHVHLHLRHDGAAEGLHDPPSQLLRDGLGGRSDAEVHRPRRRHAPLPPARPQLRQAGAPLRPVRRDHDRVPSRSARGRARDARGAADDHAERASRLREGAHRRLLRLRRRDGRPTQARRLGARRRTRGKRAAGAGHAAPARARVPDTGWPTASSSRR